MSLQVEVAFSGTDDKGDVKSVNMSAPMKVLPPWMIKQGMNLTKEQRGETSQEVKMGGNSIALETSDEKKSTAIDEDTKKIQVYLGDFVILLLVMKLYYIVQLLFVYFLFCVFL